VSGDDHRDIERQHATERGDQAVEIAIAQPGKACTGARLHQVGRHAGLPVRPERICYSRGCRWRLIHTVFATPYSLLAKNVWPSGNHGANFFCKMPFCAG
jgi:hypothetical protein